MYIVPPSAAFLYCRYSATTCSTTRAHVALSSRPICVGHDHDALACRSRALHPALTTTQMFAKREIDDDSIFNVENEGGTNLDSISRLFSNVWPFVDLERVGAHETYKPYMSEDLLSRQITDSYIEHDSFDADQAKINESVWAWDFVMTYIPVVNPILAYFTYPMVVMSWTDLVLFISNKNWMPADGGAYQAEIITPAVNGIVLPAISILFATLISQTVTTLRQRQIDLRTCLNLEACELRNLESLVDSFAESIEKNNLRRVLVKYTIRIINESAAEDEDTKIVPGKSEMNDFFSTLNQMSANKDVRTEPTLLSEAYGSVARLNSQRSTRVSALQATFPAMHYLVLCTLASSICLSFLLETNQKALIFLADTELRVLWTILIGAFSALSAICYDLLHPFRGNYQIMMSVPQFYNIRDSLLGKEEMQKKLMEVSMGSSMK